MPEVSKEEEGHEKWLPASGTESSISGTARTPCCGEHERPQFQVQGWNSLRVAAGCSRLFS